MCVFGGGSPERDDKEMGGRVDVRAWVCGHKACRRVAGHWCASVGVGAVVNASVGSDLLYVVNGSGVVAPNTGTHSVATHAGKHANTMGKAPTKGWCETRTVMTRGAWGREDVLGSEQEQRRRVVVLWLLRRRRLGARRLLAALSLGRRNLASRGGGS